MEVNEMTVLFLKLVNMSITGSFLVAAVIVLRLLLRKAPKAIHCALWAMVAIRLICPFSPESALSLMPKQEPITTESFQSEPVSPSPSVEHGFVAYESPTGEITYSGTVTVDHTGGPFPFLLWLTGIWLAGMGLMLLYAAESYLKICRKAAPSIPIGNGVWICDRIDTPFILGLIRPRIYLPSALDSADADFVLAHERTHLNRKDHWWKPLGFALLGIYWFNPVLWLAYILLCRDIEMACDEKVVKTMGIDEKKSYATALLNCSLPRHWIAVCPLAFGEVGVKQRVKNVLHYKKPAFWIILISVVLCITAAVCLLTDPASRMYLYEIDDGRNYSDLFTNTKDITLIKEGEEFPVSYPSSVCHLLDDITVREYPINRSREETRDKTHQVRLRDKLYLNFSRNFTQVWIDNLVKPSYTYRVNEPEVIRELFAIITGEKFTITAMDVTPTGMTAVYSPKSTYESEDTLNIDNYWLEVWDGSQWKKLESLEPWIPRHIQSAIILPDKERHILDWSVIHGPLPVGKYRIGRTLYFMDSGIAHDLYAEFSIADKAKIWFYSPQDAAHDNPLEDSAAQLPGAEHITLHHSCEDHQITIETETGSEVILTGWPIFAAYFHDLTGDGVDEVCTTVAEGFGLIDIRVRVYDCMEKKLYELEDRGSSNYVLAVRSNHLVVTRTAADRDEVLETGLLSLSDDGQGLTIVPLDNTFRETAFATPPVTISVEDIKPTGVTMVFHQNNELIDGKLITGYDFFLERQENGRWIKLPANPVSYHPEKRYDISTLHHHGIDWRAQYGTLSPGQYRIGKVIPLSSAEDSGTTTVYAEFTIGNVYTWFDGSDEAAANDIPLFGKDDITLIRKDFTEIQTMQSAGTATLLKGEPIRNVFLTDLTRDGISEVCATVQRESGISYVAVYDPSEGVTRTLESPDDIRYELRILNDQLVVSEILHSTGAILTMGELALEKHGVGEPASLQILPIDK